MSFIRILMFMSITLLAIVSHADNATVSPGDEFRKTAAEHMEMVNKARSEIVYAIGSKQDAYRRIAYLSREMAKIKMEFATYADQGNWDAVDWNEYHDLSRERDQYLQRVDWKYTRSQESLEAYKKEIGYR